MNGASKELRFFVRKSFFSDEGLKPPFRQPKDRGGWQLCALNCAPFSQAP